MCGMWICDWMIVVVVVVVVDEEGWMKKKEKEKEKRTSVSQNLTCKSLNNFFMHYNKINWLIFI